MDSNPSIYDLLGIYYRHTFFKTDKLSIPRHVNHMGIIMLCSVMGMTSSTHECLGAAVHFSDVLILYSWQEPAKRIKTPLNA
jgi:hypothetical protein